MADSPRVSLISLGCAKNLVDSERLLARLAQAGCVICERHEDAQILIVNTCGFIQDAKEESLDVIFQAAELKRPGGLETLIVTGCLAERYKDELARDLPEADLVVGLRSEDAIVERCIAGSAPACDPAARLRITPPHFAYVRIADGCDNRCAYCVIPDIRGPYRSVPLEDVARETAQLAQDGAREICLIAQDTTRYGLDLYGRPRLHELLPRLAGVDGVEWLRLLYTHPAHYYPELLDALERTPKLVPYVDLPLQHVTDRMLAAMRRRVTETEARRLVETLRERVPGVFIRTTFIVGFPGETDDDFEALMRFVEETRFERLGAFMYSPEEGAPAAEFPDQIPDELKAERLDALMSLQQRIAFEHNRSLIGREMECIIDGPDEERGGWIGRTFGDAPDVDGCVRVDDQTLRPGDIVRLRIVAAEGYDLVAERPGRDSV